MNMILEHPDITYALRTGYPRPGAGTKIHQMRLLRQRAVRG